MITKKLNKCTVKYNSEPKMCKQKEKSSKPVKCNKVVKYQLQQKEMSKDKIPKKQKKLMVSMMAKVH